MPHKWLQPLSMRFGFGGAAESPHPGLATMPARPAGTAMFGEAMSRMSVSVDEDLGPWEWQVISRGDPIPSSAVVVGSTASDGAVWAGRFDGEAGKINADNGNFWNFWGVKGKAQMKAEILLSLGPHEWLPIQSGQPIPPHAVKAGMSATEGLNVVGRFAGEAGKILVKGCMMAGFECHASGILSSTTRSEQAEILVAKPDPASPDAGAPNGTWEVNNSQRLGTIEDAKQYFDRAPQVDPDIISSVSKAVELLNSGGLDMPGGICIIYSSSSKVYYAIFRSDARQDFKNAFSAFRTQVAAPVPPPTATKRGGYHIPAGYGPAPGAPPLPMGTFLPSMAMAGGGGPPVMTALQQVAAALPFVSDAKVEHALEEAAGDQDLAIEALLGEAPDLKSDPEGWFHFFDGDKSGTIDFEELVHALTVTLKLDDCLPEYIEELVTKWFPAYDTDDSGAWDMEEFLEARQPILEELGAYDKDDEEYEDALVDPRLQMFRNEKEVEKAVAMLKDAFAVLPKGGVLALYFCAYLDLPYASFTSVLQDRYATFKDNNVPWEVLVVPMDATKENFELNKKEWEDTDWVQLAEWNTDRSTWRQIAGMFDVRTVPSLIIVDQTGSICTRNGVDAVTLDSTGSHCPWSHSDVRLWSLPAESNPTAALNMKRLRHTLRFDIDDEALKKEAKSVPLTVDGYKKVAGFTSNLAMRTFIKRIAETKGWHMTDENLLGELVWEHSGVRKTQTLGKLIEDLSTAEWVSKVEEEVDVPEPPEPPVGSTPVASGGVSPNRKGKGKTGKGKLPPPPPPTRVTSGIAEPESPAEDTTTAAGKAKGKGKPPGPPSSKGKGKGKGPPPPPAKGKGKGGPPGKGSGKGKGGGKGGRHQPTRADKDEWLKKKKTKLWWKRYLNGQGKVESSLFAETIERPAEEDGDIATITEEDGGAEKYTYEAGEAPVDMQQFMDAFEGKDASATTVEVKKVVVQKPVLWSGTDKQDPNKRRSELSFLAVGAFKKGSEELIQRLGEMRFNDIVSEKDFRDDNFERLANVVIPFTPDDISRLKGPESKELYMWDVHVEGFFAALFAVPKVVERLQWIRGHLHCKNVSKELLEKTTHIGASLAAISNSKAMVLVMQKVLTMGNCFNAGDANLGRADGFDTMGLLFKTLLKNMPKSDDGTSLLKFIKKVELTEDDRSDFQTLATALDGWTVPKDDCDTADLGSLTNESQGFSRELVKLEKNLQEERKDPDRAEQAEWMEKSLGDHRRASSSIDASLVKLKDDLKELQKFLIYTPERPPGGKDEDRNYLAAGFILGVMSEFAKLMAEEEKQPRRPRVSIADRPRPSLGKLGHHAPRDSTESVVSVASVDPTAGGQKHFATVPVRGPKTW